MFGKNINKSRIFIGTSGWSYEHWIGNFYPANLARNQWLRYYSNYFDTVELNMSFYRYPNLSMLEGWKNKLPENFKMTFKAHRQFTHIQHFRNAQNNLRRFYEMTDEMETRTGCVLFQAPPSFEMNKTNFNILELFLMETDPKRYNVIEFRHPSWWYCEAADLLKKHNTAFCSVSGLEMPEAHMITADFAYYRFHGPDMPYSSEYTEEHLKDYAKVIKKCVAENKVKEVYCYFNNDFQGLAIKNAMFLKKALTVSS
jgi:uncharacterized protein YecE (DUF72 family)